MNTHPVILECPQSHLLTVQFRLKSWRQGVSNDLRYFQVLTLENHQRTFTAKVYRDFLKLPKLRVGELINVTVKPIRKRKVDQFILKGFLHG